MEQARQLREAAATGDAALVARLIALGADVNAVDQDDVGDDALAAAARSGELACAEALIGAGGKIQALHFVLAAHRGSSQMIRLLAGLPASSWPDLAPGGGRSPNGAGPRRDAARDALVAAELQLEVERKAFQRDRALCALLWRWRTLAAISNERRRAAVRQKARAGRRHCRASFLAWAALAAAAATVAGYGGSEPVVERLAQHDEQTLRLRSQMQQRANVGVGRLQRSRKQLALSMAFNAWRRQVESSNQSRKVMLRAAMLLIRTRRMLLLRSLLWWHSVSGRGGRGPSHTEEEADGHPRVKRSHSAVAQRQADPATAENLPVDGSESRGCGDTDKSSSALAWAKSWSESLEQQLAVLQAPEAAIAARATDHESDHESDPSNEHAERLCLSQLGEALLRLEEP